MTKHQSGTAQKRRSTNNNNKLGNLVELRKGNNNLPSTQSGVEKAKKIQAQKKEKALYLPTKEYYADTNVIGSVLHAVLCFDEHDVHIPWQVLLELDKHKNGHSRFNMFVRSEIDLLLRLLENTPMKLIERGIPLIEPGKRKPKNKKVGKLFFGVPKQKELFNLIEDEKHPDLLILKECIQNRDNQLQKIEKANKKKAKRTERDFVFLSKDKMARIFARLLGIYAQDFKYDALDVKQVFSNNVHYFEYDFWNNEKEVIKPSVKDVRKCTRIFSARVFRKILVNEFIVIRGIERSPDKHFRVIKKKSPEVVELRELIDFTKPNNALLGITALNYEQNRALDVLLDPEIRAVLINGKYGTAKTFLVLLAAYYQMMQFNRYRRIIATRVPVGVGQRRLADLPGGVEEKMIDWLQGIKSNIRILAYYFTKHMFPDAVKKRPLPIDFLKAQILNKKKQEKSENKGNEKNFDTCFNAVFGWMNEVRNIEHLSTFRGKSLFDEFAILDEAQNNFAEELEVFFTRLGKGDVDGSCSPKIVIIGSIEQIDNHLLDTNSAYTRLVSKAVGKERLAQVTLTKGTRDPLIEYLSSVM